MDLEKVDLISLAGRVRGQKVELIAVSELFLAVSELIWSLERDLEQQSGTGCPEDRPGRGPDRPEVGSVRQGQGF